MPFLLGDLLVQDSCWNLSAPIPPLCTPFFLLVPTLPPRPNRYFPVTVLFLEIHLLSLHLGTQTFEGYDFVLVVFVNPTHDILHLVGVHLTWILWTFTPSVCNLALSLPLLLIAVLFILLEQFPMFFSCLRSSIWPWSLVMERDPVAVETRCGAPCQ